MKRRRNANAAGNKLVVRLLLGGLAVSKQFVELALVGVIVEIVV
jgi:hypothetical protein